MRIGGSRVFWASKRAFDGVLSLALLPVVGLLGLLLCLLNPLLNPGPLLFCQTRVGHRGRHFVIYKFRTMRMDVGGARFADTEAHRITPFARFLRQARIDELPQVINVLRGEMSLIGPRPEQPQFAHAYGNSLPFYDRRHLVRPGLSGLAQVVLGYTSDTQGTQKKLSHDLRYITQSGFRMEAYVFWRTLLTLATGYGAR